MNAVGWTQTLPGIDSVIALTILIEGGDLRRFAHHRQFLKYCDLDLAKSRSGTQRGKERRRGGAARELALAVVDDVAGCGRRLRHGRGLRSLCSRPAATR